MQIKTISRVLKEVDERYATKAKKTPKQLERFCKGIANHRRIQILLLISRKQGITVEKIAEELECNFKTISAHTQKLVQAGLIEKKYLGHNVLHSLTPIGKQFRSFLTSF